jgi:hypothetical protein
MPNILVCAHGFLGDILFASSLPQKLVDDAPGTAVDFYTPLPQPLLVLKQNPYIHHVLTDMPHHKFYDRVIQLGKVDQHHPATWQFQKLAGISNPSTAFYVYVDPDLETHADRYLEDAKKDGRPIIAYQANWAERTYLYNKEQYELGIDRNMIITPDRDINSILTALYPHCVLVEVGLPREFNQYSQQSLNPQLYAFTASIMKRCDWVIGSEGGITNLAAGVGTNTIITTDFMWRQYGPDGHFKKIPMPQMGPMVYFPEKDHVALSPYLTDAEVANAIIDIIRNHNLHYRNWFVVGDNQASAQGL